MSLAASIASGGQRHRASEGCQGWVCQGGLFHSSVGRTWNGNAEQREYVKPVFM